MLLTHIKTAFKCPHCYQALGYPDLSLVYLYMYRIYLCMRSSFINSSTVCIIIRYACCCILMQTTFSFFFKSWLFKNDIVLNSYFMYWNLKLFWICKILFLFQRVHVIVELKGPYYNSFVIKILLHVYYPHG